MPTKLGDPGLSSNITGFSWNRLPTFATSSSEFLAFSQETFSTKIITTDQGELSHEEDNLKLNVLRKSTTPFKSDKFSSAFKRKKEKAIIAKFNSLSLETQKVAPMAKIKPVEEPPEKIKGTFGVTQTCAMGQRSR